MSLVISSLMSAMAAKPLLGLGLSETEIQVLLAAARREMNDPSIHAYLNFLCWQGQKPTGSEGEAKA